jgi:hypothetical protein
MLEGWAEMTKTKPSGGNEADCGPAGGMFDSSTDSESLLLRAPPGRQTRNRYHFGKSCWLN